MAVTTKIPYAPSSSAQVPSMAPCICLSKSTSRLALDGFSLTPKKLVSIGYDQGVHIDLTADAWKLVEEGRNVIQGVLDRGETVYGINTGFGLFSEVVIGRDKLEQLQYNLIRSHSAGVGDPLSPERTRMLLALRINVLAKGHSGIRTETLERMVSCFNHNCLPYVPCQGTVGASGDLAPLAHLALGMIGEGKMWDEDTKTYVPSMDVLSKHKIEPISLTAKEGLALINGTQLITSIGCEALERAKTIARQADIVAALSLEVLKGTVKAFHPRIHKARPHGGQQLVAERIRSLLHTSTHPSEISLSHQDPKVCTKVQDSYTMRCVPQIHGIVFDTLRFVEEILTTECNSATDNPMIFADLPSSHEEDISRECQPLASRGTIISGGNFHGEYPAKVMDYLAIGIHEISNVSERRIERLCNPHLSGGLPAFLVKDGGLNSGFMIPHCTAASLVSENKVLTHPSSVDSISTSAAKEDHVSMGGFAARKALRVVEHVENVLAIELLAACQGIEFHRPLTTTEPLEKVHALIRTVVSSYDEDRYFQPDIDAVRTLLCNGDVWRCVEKYVPGDYHSLRSFNGMSSL